MVARIILSLLLCSVWAISDRILNVFGTIASGTVAGMQFNNSNADAVITYTTMPTLQNLHAPTLLFLAVLAMLWWRPVRALFLIGLLVIAVHPAYAYYDTHNYTEAYTILPNESAFWIPDVGANKDTQTHLDSEQYLADHKVAVKRFIIPHTTLSGSGFVGWTDYYVPAGRLIIVDRTPYSREWVDAADRGTSASKQGFPCQSKEGLNITTGVSVGASVTQEDAPKFLYHFGVLAPDGKRNDPQVIFTSVYYGRSLQNVMDDVGRKKVQTLVCDEISKRPFDAVNADAAQIMHTVQTEATAWFANVGITLDFIGWADTFSFDKQVQDAIDRRYVAEQDKVIASELRPYADTIQALASASAIRDWGAHADGKLPSTIVGLPPQLGNLLSTILQMPTAPAVSNTFTAPAGH